MPTPRNVLQHELIGLEGEVISSTNRSQVGIKGEVIDETMNTVSIRSGKGIKKIQKRGSLFRLTLGKLKVEVDGNELLSRPEDRIKKRVRRW